MDVARVVAENWPDSTSMLNYGPVAIAVIALFVSLYSVHLTRRSFIASHRPYVWAASYSVLDSAEGTLVPVPKLAGLCVHNAPARVLRLDVAISLDAQNLLVTSESEMVRFPDGRSEGTHSISQRDFESLMSRPDEEKARLRRIISVKYSSLAGGKAYRYTLQQLFLPADNQWKNVAEEAD